MENTIGIIPNTFHDFQKNFKSVIFESYKSFVPVEVQSHNIFYPGKFIYLGKNLVIFKTHAR